MWSYSPIAVEHQLKPINLGLPEGELIVGVAGDGFGDTEYRLGFRLDSKGSIEAMGFEYVGSAQSVASASMLGEMVLGRTLAFAATINESNLDRALGGLPELVLNRECLSLGALRDAYRKWAVVNGDPSNRLVCTCKSVFEATIVEATRSGALTVQDVGEATDAGTGCRTCKPALVSLIGREKAAREQADASDTLGRRLGDADRARLELIEEVLDAEVRPGLALDGGGLEVMDLDGKHLTLRFRGACVSCNQSGSTMRFLVEDRLHSMVDPGLEIVTV